MFYRIGVNSCPFVVKIINLISGPRNVSTALMYSFAQREDTAVVDEPLYGHYLSLTHAPQPHWEEMIEVLENDLGARNAFEGDLGVGSSLREKHVFGNESVATELDRIDLGDHRRVRLITAPDPAEVGDDDAPRSGNGVVRDFNDVAWQGIWTVHVIPSSVQVMQIGLITKRAGNAVVGLSRNPIRVLERLSRNPLPVAIRFG